MAYPIPAVNEPVLGSRSFEAEILSSGATSTAWRVRCDHKDLVVRTPRPDSKRPITYRSEHRILEALYAQDQPVPQPISVGVNQALHALANASTWSITGPAAGTPLGSDRLTREAALCLGRLLQALHALPCSGYGRLTETSSELHGQQRTPIEGMLARWNRAKLWPFDQSNLSRHAIARLAPDLLDDLLQAQPSLWTIASESHTVINHSDLHGQHIFVNGGQLSGVIDFGAVFIGGPGWDFAVLAFYHGWQTASMVLESYEPDLIQRRELLRRARYLALVVALYKLEKAINHQPTTQQLKQITGFTTDTLLLLDEQSR